MKREREARTVILALQYQFQFAFYVVDVGNVKGEQQQNLSM